MQKQELSGEIRNFYARKMLKQDGEEFKGERKFQRRIMSIEFIRTCQNLSEEPPEILNSMTKLENNSLR